MKKRIVGLFLTLTMLLSLLPVSAFAATEVASGTCGSNLTWSLDSDGVLTISGTGEMADWTHLDYAPWYSHRSNMASAVIENGVTSIGKMAFYECDELTSVTVPSSVTSIGGMAFNECSNLTSIVIPNGVTIIGSDAFFGCSSLTSVTIPSSVSSIGEGAFDCIKLTEINVDLDNSEYMDVDGVLFNRSGTQLHTYPAGKNETTYVVPDSVVSIERQAFSDCVNLKSITVSGSVMQIGEWAFADSKNLESVFIPDSVKSIGNYAFENCINLTNATIPNGITSIGEREFSGCTSLKNIVIPSSVTSIGDKAFYNCAVLTSVIIPSGVTSIGDKAFYNCAALTSVIIPSSVTSIKTLAFGNCTSLSAISVESGNSNYIDIDGVLFSADGTLLHIYPSSKTDLSYRIPEGVTSIEYYAFWNCTSLTSITIPSSVTGIEAYAFENCTSLTNVTIPSSVTSIWNGVFDYCDALNDIYFGGSEVEWTSATNSNNRIGLADTVTIHYNSTGPDANIVASGTCGDPNVNNGADVTWSLDSDGVLTISGTGDMADWPAVSNIPRPNTPWISQEETVKTVVIESGVTSIGNYAFYRCVALTSVTIPDSITRIGSDAFYGCKSLTSVAIPDSVTNIGTEAFLHCASLTAITVGNGNAAYRDIDGVLFSNDGTLLIAYPTGKTTQTYTIPTGVTSIGASAFAFCSELMSVIIPNSVTNIGYAAFNGYIETIALTDIFFGGSEAEWNAAIGENDIGLVDTVTIHYNSTGPDANIVASGTCGDQNVNGGKDVTWTLDSDGVLTISGTGDMGNWDGFRDAPWCSHYDNIVSVVIEDGVTCIGENAFNGCSDLISVTIPNGVTFVGNGAFNECRNLQNLTIPASVTSIGVMAFSGCRLGSVSIPSNVTYIGEMAFSSCNALTSIAVSDDNLTYRDENGVLFSVDGTLLHTYPKGKTDMSYSIPNGVTTIGKGAFWDCDKLESVTIPYGVAETGDYAFIACDGLTTIVLPSSMTRICDEAFRGCTHLPSIVIPNSVTSIGNNVFAPNSLVPDMHVSDIYYSGSEAEWVKAIGANNLGVADGLTIHYNSVGPVPTQNLTLSDAVKFVPYSQMLEGVDGTVVTFRADAALPAWLTLDTETGELSGIPTEVGTYDLTATVLADGIETVQYKMSLSVKNNTTAAVTQESAAELTIEQTISNMTTESLSDQVFEIEDKIEEVKSNFEKFLDVYLDGVKLNGGKVGENETVKTVEDVPDEWEYYAEEGSTKITVRAQTFQKRGTGTHTLAATFNKVDTEGKPTGETMTAAQNFTITSPSGGGGGGGSTPQPPKPQAQDNGAIQYTVKDGVARLDVKSMDKLTETAKTNKTITLDFTSSGQTVTVATLSPGMIDQLTKLLTSDEYKAENLAVKLSSGSLTFDAAALSEIAKQANGAELSLFLKEVTAVSLTMQQQEALKAIDAEKVFSVEIKAGDKQIADFGGGRVTIVVPLTVSEGRSARGYAAWYLTEDAVTIRHSSDYVDGMLAFRTAHFSYYAVAYQEMKNFADVLNGQWYASDVNHMVSLGVMNGVSAASFAPNMELNRAMIAQILYNLEKVEADASTEFEDVSDSDWFAEAVNWAAGVGIVEGVGNGKYEPTRAVTRAELVAMLYKYALYKQYNVTNATDLNRFPDSANLPDWAKSAMQWAVGNKLISGIAGRLAADETASRAQVAKVLTYFLELYEK